MKPTIKMIENGKVVIEYLNKHHFCAEIDTNDILFLKINGDDTVNLSFLIDDIETAKNLEKTNDFKYCVSSYDENKFYCRLINQNFKCDVSDSLKQWKNFPKNVCPNFICVQDDSKEIIFIHFDKLLNIGFSSNILCRSVTFEACDFKLGVGQQVFLITSLEVSFNDKLIELLRLQLESDRIKKSNDYDNMNLFLETINNVLHIRNIIQKKINKSIDF